MTATATRRAPDMLSSEIDVVMLVRDTSPRIAGTVGSPFVPRHKFMAEWFAIDLERKTMHIPSLEKIRAWEWARRTYIGGVLHEYLHIVFLPIHHKLDIATVMVYGRDKQGVPPSPEYAGMAVNIASDIVNEMLVTIDHGSLAEYIAWLKAEHRYGEPDPSPEDFRDPVKALLLLHELAYSSLRGRTRVSAADLAYEASRAAGLYGVPKPIAKLYVAVASTVKPTNKRTIAQAHEIGLPHYMAGNSYVTGVLVSQALDALMCRGEPNTRFWVNIADPVLAYFALAEAVYVLLATKVSRYRAGAADILNAPPDAEEADKIYRFSMTTRPLDPEKIDDIAQRIGRLNAIVPKTQDVPSVAGRRRTRTTWLSACFGPPTPESVVEGEATGLGPLAWYVEEEKPVPGTSRSHIMASPPSTVTLVVDESFSTIEEPIPPNSVVPYPALILEVERAVGLALARSLAGKKTVFNIIRFSDTVKNETGLKPEQAAHLLSTEEALLGGTDIVRAVRSAAAIHGRRRGSLMVVMTDAVIEPSEAEEVARLLARMPGRKLVVIINSDEEVRKQIELLRRSVETIWINDTSMLSALSGWLEKTIRSWISR